MTPQQQRHIKLIQKSYGGNGYPGKKKISRLISMLDEVSHLGWNRDNLKFDLLILNDCSIVEATEERLIFLDKSGIKLSFMRKEDEILFFIGNVRMKEYKA